VLCPRGRRFRPGWLAALIRAAAKLRGRPVLPPEQIGAVQLHVGKITFTWMAEHNARAVQAWGEAMQALRDCCGKR
jgi:hypothetical protein